MDEDVVGTDALAKDVKAAEAAVGHARRLFLDRRNIHGCAETAFITLKTVYGLDDAADSSAAMALNGGVAYSGGACGAITGAALAVGLLAGRRLADHREAKRVARELVAEVMTAFEAEQGSVNCRDLIGLDLTAPGAHRAFLRSGTWIERCMPQIEFVVRRLAPLAGSAAWEGAVHRVSEQAPG